MSYNKILDNLYLGDQYSTQIIKNINLIISIGCCSKHIDKKIENIKISIRDKITSDMTPFIDNVCDLIKERLDNNQKILVHCKAGINRSPAFIIAYLIKYNNMNLDEAKNYLILLRKVKFKENFMNQIENHFLNN
jgi:protein-tyrosine phosphatase